MKRNALRSALYATTAISLLGLPVRVFAADDVEEIVVTARRVAERLQDVPISMTVLNQQQVSDRNITTASDLAGYIPSLSTDKRFGPDNSSFSIRGFRTLPVITKSRTP